MEAGPIPQEEIHFENGIFCHFDTEYHVTRTLVCEFAVRRTKILAQSSCIETGRKNASRQQLGAILLGHALEDLWKKRHLKICRQED